PDKLRAARAIHARNNRSLRYAPIPKQRSLDLPRLNPETANLNLLVRATHKLQHPIKPPARQVPAAVHPTPRPTKPTRNKALRTQPPTTQIPPPNPNPPNANPPHPPSRNPETANLTLLVRATHKLQHPIQPPARQVPAAVHPTPRPTNPIRNKALRTQPPTTQIPPPNPSSRNVKLPNYPDRNRLQTIIQNVTPRAPNPTTNRRHSHPTILQH